MLWDGPHVHTHWTSLKAFDSVRHASIAVDRGRRREFECYCNLLMLDFWYRTVPTLQRCRRLCTAFECRRPLMAFERMRTHCEGISENAALILDCWPLHTAERFGTVYRIVSWYFVQYHIVSIVFPHGHIMPSLLIINKLPSVYRPACKQRVECTVYCDFKHRRMACMYQWTNMSRQQSTRQQSDGSTFYTVFNFPHSWLLWASCIKHS